MCAKYVLYNNEEIRIVMVGKTGAGKSASANTILGGEKFKAKRSSKSVTEHCAKADGQVDGQRVSVIDTPGLFDTKIDQETTCRNITQCLAHASPGPQIFLVVIRSDIRFTEEEKRAVQMIQQIFGKGADKYSMVLFTHGDQLGDEPFEEFLGENEELKELVAKCNGQYHVFDNNQKGGAQVRELLRKIRDISKKNGGSHYTTEMFQEAERAIEEEKKRILRAEAERIRKEQKDLERKLEEKYEEKIREAKKDLKKEKELRAELEKQKKKEIAELSEEQERAARRKAETSSTVLQVIGAVAGLVLAVVSRCSIS